MCLYTKVLWVMLTWSLFGKMHVMLTGTWQSFFLIISSSWCPWLFKLLDEIPSSRRKPSIAYWLYLNFPMCIMYCIQGTCILKFRIVQHISKCKCVIVLRCKTPTNFSYKNNITILPKQLYAKCALWGSWFQLIIYQLYPLIQSMKLFAPRNI